jgi:hypothetical protein
MIQETSDDARQHVAILEGVCGGYRYLAFSTQTQNITEIGLLRSDSLIKSPPAGYDGMSADINKGRGKTYLYVIWKEFTV